MLRKAHFEGGRSGYLHIGWAPGSTELAFSPVANLTVFTTAQKRSCAKPHDITWQSSENRRNVTPSTESELIGMSMAFQCAVPLKKTLKKMKDLEFSIYKATTKVIARSMRTTMLPFYQIIVDESQEYHSQKKQHRSNQHQVMATRLGGTEVEEKVRCQCL